MFSIFILTVNSILLYIKIQWEMVWWRCSGDLVGWEAGTWLDNIQNFLRNVTRKMYVSIAWEIGNWRGLEVECCAQRTSAGT